MASKSNAIGKDNSGIPARELAVKALSRVLDRNRTPEEGLYALPGWDALTPEDKGMSHFLLLGTLRCLGQVDAWMAKLMEKPLPTTASQVQDILRIGLYQLGWMGTPAHAAVDTSVNLTRQMRLDGFSSLVNAVLRRASREGVPKGIMENASLNLQEWLRTSWQKAYGKDLTETICHAQIAIPPIDIQVKAEAAIWAEKLGGMLLPGGSIRIPPQTVTNLSGYAEGEWWVQDAAACLPVKLLGEVKGKTIVDLCAAPGGKTMQLAAAGAKVIAVDRSEPRLQRLKENLERTGLQAEVICEDGKQWKPSMQVDGVLLDAPCSATGTLRRHPEISWTRKQEDITRMAALQWDMLTHVLSWLPSGKPLVYATCSLQPEEGEAHVQRLLREHKDVTLLPVQAAETAIAQACRPDGALRTLPHFWQEQGGMDGFFAARLVKN